MELGLFFFVRDLLSPIQNDAQYHAALGAFKALLSEAETEGPGPTLELVHVLGEHLRAYEQREPATPVGGVKRLRFLMEQHGLTQSEVLGSKRQLNVRQAKALATRFKVDFSAFLR